MKLVEAELRSVSNLIESALSEDVQDGDITTNNLLEKTIKAEAKIITKEKGVIAGLQVAEAVFRKLDDLIIWNPKVEDGVEVEKGEEIVNFSGSYRAILTGERTALNFLQRMSGIASLSAKFVKAVEGIDVKILDTRKTLPGFRILDKYSVKAGGAENHRIGLFDMVMIKDNHIDIAGSISNAVKSIRGKVFDDIKIEVETKNIAEVKEALNAGADIIMLDNMKNEEMKECVKIINHKAKVEASGNVTLERIRSIAETGVDYISIGALTHSIKALDLSQYIIKNG